MAARDPVEEYVPGRRFELLYYGALPVSLSLGLLIAFTFGDGTLYGPSALFWLAGLLIGAHVGPLLIRYRILRRLGARLTRQRWYENWSGDDYLISSWRARGVRFTRKQFAAFYGGPALFMYALMFLYAARFPGTAPASRLALRYGEPTSGTRRSLSGARKARSSRR